MRPKRIKWHNSSILSFFLFLFLLSFSLSSLSFTFHSLCLFLSIFLSLRIFTFVSHFNASNIWSSLFRTSLLHLLFKDILFVSLRLSFLFPLLSLFQDPFFYQLTAINATPSPSRLLKNAKDIAGCIFLFVFVCALVCPWVCAWVCVRACMCVYVGGWGWRQNHNSVHGKNGSVHYKEHFLLVAHVSLTSSPLTHNFFLFLFSLFRRQEVLPKINLLPLQENNG